jgi:hypothetical protein
MRMRGRRLPAALVAASLSLGGLLVGAGPAAATTAGAPAPVVPGTASNFTLVGHDALFDRGENAAPALYDDGVDTWVYVGSRSDGTHLHSGVEIEKVTDPANPTNAGEIPLPAALDLGYTSRELRVWPQQKMLMVMYFGCSALIHACASAADTGEQPLRQFDFFDLSQDPSKPTLVSSYGTPTNRLSTTPHEMFLWVDPVHAGRALLYWTSPNNPVKQLIVTDISGWRTGTFVDIASMGTPNYTSDETSNFDVRLHSLSVSPDGTRAYLAYLGGGVLVVDSSDMTDPSKANAMLRLVTPVANRAFWDYEGAHSAVKIPGKPYLFTTEEIYGKGTPALSAAFGPAFGGCPWGWVRIIDMHDETNLTTPPSEYRIAENQAAYCSTVTPQQDNFSSYTSHNPTLLPDLALITWHSGGLQAIDLSDPTQPTQAGYFVPTPDALAPNHTDDPALEPGSNGVIAWSYPIIHNGLIYFIDIRNGLFIVRYSGAHADEVNGVSFLEGNSNLGDAARLEASAPAADAPEAPRASLLGIAGVLVLGLLAAARVRRRLRPAA